MQQSVPGQALLPRRPAADVAGGAAELRLLAAGRRRAVRRGPHRLLDCSAAVRFPTHDQWSMLLRYVYKPESGLTHTAE